MDPVSSAITTMPDFIAVRSPAPGGNRWRWPEERTDGERRRLVGFERDGEEPTVDAIAGIAMMIAHHLGASEGPDRGAHQNVARPVSVVVHPRDADERGPGV